MNILIVGSGKVGDALAAGLRGEGNDITIIDQDPEKVKAIANKYDIMGVIGNGATRTIQKEAGVDEADLLIAVTGTDEINLLSCLVAKHSSDCSTIARLKNPDYSIDAPYFKDELGLAMVINPERASAKEISRILNFPSAVKIETFGKGRIELLSFKVPAECRLTGMSIREVTAKFKCGVTFCTIEREAEAYIANGDFVFAERDLVSIVASPEGAKDFFQKINYKLQPIKDVVIVGGGETTHYLCQRLEHSGISVKVIEKNPALCSDLATDFDYATIINGDPADEDILREEGIGTASAFVALTGVDEENILLSLFAKRQGCRKVITKINKTEYDDIVNHLELDSVIYPKNITADMIIRYVRARENTRGSNIETLYNLIKGKVEALEFTVNEASPVVNVPLSELNFKPDVLIAAIIRDGEQIIPRGQSVIEPGDSVIVVTKQRALNDISDVLK